MAYMFCGCHCTTVFEIPNKDIAGINIHIGSPYLFTSMMIRIPIRNHMWTRGIMGEVHDNSSCM